MDEIKVRNEYELFAKYLIENKISISLMESCSGGIVASFLTDVEGISDIYKGSFVTYSNEGKIKCGVDEEIINKYGVYSEETAKEMANSASAIYNTDIGLGITGSLGRIDPQNNDSKIGEVFIAVKVNEKITAKKFIIEESNRHNAKVEVARNALLLMKEILR